MTTDRFLSTPLRRDLERTIKEARTVAEGAAAIAVARLGVAEAAPPAWLDEAGKELRRRLRAHGRALGDRKNPDDTQEIGRLIEAAAYEQWHRRLFARFLAERGLLHHPAHGVTVTLEECKDLASGEGFTDEWAAAESYAANMLPAVFRPDDPALALELAPEHAQALRKLVLDLDPATFQADDALGWTYQFWRAQEKKRVNESGVKIGAAELPAVTQLFTEPYMVRFLLHNTLGAWRAGKVLAARPELAAGAPDEAALRAAVALPGYEFDVLRFVKEGADAPRWRPAAGAYPGWPAEAQALTVLDPCCGSGHFLTEAMTILSALRMEEERLSPAEAVAAVLRENLFGLELDGRCVQIAVFAVALAAWKLGGFQTLSTPHIAWVGAPPPLPQAEFMALANGDEDLRRGLGILHGLFAQAPLLGSLLDPDRGDLGEAHGALDFAPMLSKLIEKAKRAQAADIESREGVIAARGMADAAAMLRGRYVLIATNVPFLGRGEQTESLANHIDSRFPDSKADLSTVMMQRSMLLLNSGGTAATVSKQEWCFLVSYRDYRKHMLNTYALNFFVTLGEEAWEAFGDRGPLATLASWTRSGPDESSTHFTIDATNEPDRPKKRALISQHAPRLIGQREQLANPDSRLLTELADAAPLLEVRAKAYQGISTGDVDRYRAMFWEVRLEDRRWRYFASTVSEDRAYGGMEHVLFWGYSGDHLAAVRGNSAWERKGVALSQMRHLPAAIYTGAYFDGNVSAIIPDNEENLPAIFTYCTSPRYKAEIKRIDKKKNVTNATLVKVPFDLEYWKSLAEQTYPEGLPEPYSDDPTQWLFHGHPAKAEVGTQLHVALARLAGYRWPAETDVAMRLAPEAREWIAKAQDLPSCDPDGILTLPAAGGDRPLAERLRDFLAVAYGEAWSEALERRLVADADEKLDKKAARDGSLEGWLRDRAFRQHSRLFHDRPFLWQIWDGQRDGFSAYLHYHRLATPTLQKLTYTVLGGWIGRRKDENDDRRVEAATILQGKLKAILEGEAPYDIFVRWKPLERQPLGWDPDMDDGVRLNIRPWVGASILRETPKITWSVDRGADVASSPWYALNEGRRNNDLHTSLAEKRAARAARSASAA